MASFYADEDFPQEVVLQLQTKGHDVLTVRDEGRQGGTDGEVLDFAIAKGRAVLTLNRWHFIRLHRFRPVHKGIVVCTDDDPGIVADKIDKAVSTVGILDNQLIRINRTP